eukprot:m.215628 g.215628  ORF g.215628 m.215628 type:complete len:193 (+) comp19108_c1_seq1:317-895(+)
MPREIPKVRQTASRAELMDMRYAAAKAGGHQIDVEMSLSYDEGTGQLFASLVSASNFSKEFEGKTVQLALIFIGFGGERRSTSKTVKVTDQHVVFNSKTGSLLWDVTKNELSTANIRVRIYTTAWMGLMKSELLGENVVALRGKKFADGTVKERITLYQDLIGQTTDTKRKFYEGGSDAVANSDTESPSPTK